MCRKLLSEHMTLRLSFHLYCLSPSSHVINYCLSLPVQWICSFEGPCSSPSASIPLPFPLGSLGRGRGGGGGGGIRHSLPQEELLEDRVHLATDLLWDEINNGGERERKKRQNSPLFSAPTSARDVPSMFVGRVKLHYCHEIVSKSVQLFIKTLKGFVSYN